MPRGDPVLLCPSQIKSSPGLTAHRMETFQERQLRQEPQGLHAEAAS